MLLYLFLTDFVFVRGSRLKDYLDNTVLAANSKGRLYIAILGGSELGLCERCLVIVVAVD